MLERYYRPLPERYIRYQGKTIHFSACWYTIAKFLSTDPTLTLCPNNSQSIMRLWYSWWILTSQHPVKSHSPLPSIFHIMTLYSLVHIPNSFILCSLKIIITNQNLYLLCWSCCGPLKDAKHLAYNFGILKVCGSLKTTKEPN